MRLLVAALFLGISLGIAACGERVNEQGNENPEVEVNVEAGEMQGPYLLVLGVAQDAGYPQAGCAKSCCAPAWSDHSKRRSQTCLALVDPDSKAHWLFEATPSLPQQISDLNHHTGSALNQQPKGVFLTHAHIGHYTGLMHFGREVQGASEIPVHAMPRMSDFLRNNAPWSQLVSLNNISLQALQADSTISLTPNLSVTPLLVPHRDEFSETVGFRIASRDRKALFIPDINKWQVWDRDLATELQQVDLAFLDATFFKAGELPGRNMAEIPHPFVQETMELLRDLPASEKQKVKFIHFNHTNPILWDPAAAQEVRAAGFDISEEGETYSLN